MSARLVAATHPAAYLIHKYWARKPHNVLATLFARHRRVRRPQLFVDPFCGSGVPLSEAARLGFEVAGGDVNPAAVAISRVTLAPPEAKAFGAEVLRLLEEVEEAHADLFRTPAGPLRYAVHATVVLCAGCGREVASVDAQRAGRKYLCRCGAPLAFNLASLAGTRVIQVTGTTGTTAGTGACRKQEWRSAQARFGGGDAYDHPFAENRRVLAFDGLSTRRLFTARNWSALTMTAERFHRIADPRLREAALVLLTSAAAQSSRLIPFRNDLATGGQAWSVPGFWVPPLHLETNPLLHLRARTAKLVRGLRELAAMPGRLERPSVELRDAGALLQSLARSGRRADLVFLDPPYGDSVPYVEFSAIWNSFLGRRASPDADLAVSDRLSAAEGWRRYRTGLVRVLRALQGALAPEGKVIATFNNNDPRAWDALLEAFEEAGLRPGRFVYQEPAVVSAKSQLARKGSYVGDFYCTLTRGVTGGRSVAPPCRRSARSCVAAGR